MMYTNVSLSDRRRKVRRWCFTLTSFTTNDDIYFLKTLPRKVFSYVAFALCKDDTGNNFIQGFCYTTNRWHESCLKRIFDTRFMLTIPGTVHYVKLALFSIFTAENPHEEYGDRMHARGVGYVDEVKDYKRSVDSGVPFEELVKRYPDVVFRFSFQVRKHLGIVTIGELGASEWVEFGQPHPLAWKIYQYWRHLRTI